MSMGDGGGVGVVFSFNCLRSWGRSPGIDSSTTSLNILHPSATVLCPSKIILWPDATFLMATTILTQNTFSSTCSTFIWLSIITGTVLILWIRSTWSTYPLIFSSSSLFPSDKFTPPPYPPPSAVPPPPPPMTPQPIPFYYPAHTMIYSDPPPYRTPNINKMYFI